ncbi:MAG: regulatory protein RecX [Saprospiraceae bacterium]|jgi:regulatory protein|nr:RecX family transcriptional regulator [Saprospiraceae bacterium]MBP6446553.1 RecX family transcriptional regulator [Saprospiraceae bacterium]
MKKQYWSRDEALLNIQKYCALQERCHQEVRFKLIEHSIYGDILEELIADLITNDFLNEERFAKTYARGKFRMKNWGKNKIIHELKLRKVSNYCINEALKEIDENDYIQILKTIIEKKNTSTTFKNQFDRLKKLTDFALSKGYEYEIIQDVIKTV